MRYLNRLRLKQDSLVIERKETGKSLYDFAMVVLSRIKCYPYLAITTKSVTFTYCLLSSQ